MQPLPLRAAADIFRYLSLEESRGLALWVSCFEIYGGKLYDLLNGRQQLVMREDGKGRVCIVGLKEVGEGPAQNPSCTILRPQIELGHCRSKNRVALKKLQTDAQRLWCDKNCHAGRCSCEAENNVRNF